MGAPLPIRSDLDTAIYDIRKCSGLAHQYDPTLWENNIRTFKEKFAPGVSSYFGDGFWYHRVTEGETVERFVASLKLDSPNMPEIFEKLDDFILKNGGAYKISLYNKDWKSTRLPNDTNRTDTINLYMEKPITAQLAKEFYEIVKPVLQEETHEFLDGFPIRNNGQEIKGIKFGPEPQECSYEAVHNAKNRLKNTLPHFMVNELNINDIRSLGKMAATTQLGNLLYYLIGQEGKNPIQLGNQFGDPQKRYTKTAIEINPQTTKMYSIFHKLNLFRKG